MNNKKRESKKKQNITFKKKKRKKKYTLEELLANIKPESRYEEIDFGPPVGKEKFWE